jgi:2-hydroxychromene-2-carboxylate isomerase
MHYCVSQSLERSEVTQSRNAMRDPNSETSIRFYFSFRSPYAWLAAERLESELGDLGVRVELFPIYPTVESFPNDPAAVPEKVAYMVQDILRLTRERGSTVRFPSPTDQWGYPPGYQCTQNW